VPIGRSSLSWASHSGVEYGRRQSSHRHAGSAIMPVMPDLSVRGHEGVVAGGEDDRWFVDAECGVTGLRRRTCRGHRLVDDQLEVVRARCRRNTLWVTVYRLKVFFTVVDRNPVGDPGSSRAPLDRIDLDLPASR
jgi:hypothetical protein